MTTIARPGIRPDRSGLFCREKLEPGALDTPDTDTADDTVIEAEKALLCSSCRAVVTSHQHAVEINNSHFHTFFNPAGIIYEIRCFSQAMGCVAHGRATDEFSWFSGYTWRYALCATCLAHLGWVFYSPGHAFFGLINSKLIDE